MCLHVAGLSVRGHKGERERERERLVGKILRNGGCSSVSEFGIKTSIAVYFRDASHSLPVFDEHRPEGQASVYFSL